MRIRADAAPGLAHHRAGRTGIVEDRVADQPEGHPPCTKQRDHRECGAAHPRQQQAGNAPGTDRQQQPAQWVGGFAADPAAVHDLLLEARMADQHRRATGAEHQRQQHPEPEQQPLRASTAQQAWHQRRQCQAEHRQGRQDVDIALAAGNGEEHQHQQPPGQRQQIARVAPLEPAPPRRDRPRQQQDGRQPHRGHALQVVPDRLRVIPGAGVALGGLAQQDVVEIHAVFGLAGGQRRHHHRHEPQQDRHEEEQRPQPEAPVAHMHAHTRPTTRRGNPGRDQHQQRDDAHTLGDHAQAGGKPAQRPPAPGRAHQQMAQQSVIGQGDPEHHQRVDLRLLGLEGEVQRKQQHPGRIETDAPGPHAPAQIVDAGQCAQRGQQRRQQERHPPIAQQRVGQRLQPHQHRWLVRIQLVAAMREQPVAAQHHLLGHQRKARLVRRPRVTQTQAGTDHQHGGHGQQPDIGGSAILEHVGRQSVAEGGALDFARDQEAFSKSA